MEKSNDDLHLNFPLTIATCPFRIPNTNVQPIIDYDVCCDHVEGGQYIGPEFQLGQVYDGSLGMEEGETIVLYRPVYVCVRKSSSFNKHQEQSIANNNSRGNKSNSISKKNSISQLQSINELNTSLHCDPGPSRRC
ncbi:hypothetical protein QR98_0010870 [Sarcoptes scabiei]|nr:hypothetical protein QR98_0010870 [Sarcoptes scabiei]